MKKYLHSFLLSILVFVFLLPATGALAAVTKTSAAPTTTLSTTAQRTKIKTLKKRAKKKVIKKRVAKEISLRKTFSVAAANQVAGSGAQQPPAGYFAALQQAEADCVAAGHNQTKLAACNQEYLNAQARLVQQ